MSWSGPGLHAIEFTSMGPTNGYVVRCDGSNLNPYAEGGVPIDPQNPKCDPWWSLLRGAPCDAGACEGAAPYLPPPF